MHHEEERSEHRVDGSIVLNTRWKNVEWQLGKFMRMSGAVMVTSEKKA